jgi:hypothetical protein
MRVGRRTDSLKGFVISPQRSDSDAAGQRELTRVHRTSPSFCTLL